MASVPLQNSANEIASGHPEVEFALVLARTIDLLQSDPEQLRSAVYDLARHKLAQLSHEDPTERERLMQALETAISGVEAYARKYPSGGGPLPRPVRVQRTEALVDPSDAKAGVNSEQSWNNAKLVPSFTSNGGRRWSSSTPLRYLAMLLFFAGLAVLIFAQRHGWSPPSFERFVESYRSVKTSELTVAREPSPAPDSLIPLSKEPERKIDPLVPTAYGVYAVSADHLFELQSLLGRVPDPRVAISAAITKPSDTRLPDGHIRFIVFRRETPTAQSPDRVELRVVAQVKQATKFDALGKPVVSSEESWVIRNVSIPYHAAPLKDEPGMYQVLPRDPNLTLSPGRYVLALTDQAFDFTVGGKVTDKRQCLEQIVAANGVFYSECQN